MRFLSMLVIVFLALQSYAQEKNWTLLVYMNAHGVRGQGDDLSDFARQNLRWMQKVGSTENINIVVEVGTSDSPDAQRLLIQKNKIQVLEKRSNVNMGSVEELKDFISWTVKNYPAQHYFMDIWNHGTGWHAFSKEEDPAGKWHPGGNLQISSVDRVSDISYDYFTKEYITTEQVGEAMRFFRKLIGHKVDIYGSDACQMAMAEVAAEMYQDVNYFVGSQELEPGEGWPYDKFLMAWTENPKASPAEITKFLIKSYDDYYSHGGGVTDGMGVTLSSLDLNYFEQFMEAVRSLKEELVTLTQRDAGAIYRIIATVDRYRESPDYKDFYHLVKKLKASNVGMDKTIINAVESLYKNLVVANKARGDHEGRSFGVSIWLPNMKDMNGQPMMGVTDYYSQNIQRFQNLKFNKKTGWAEFLSVLQ